MHGRGEAYSSEPHDVEDLGGACVPQAIWLTASSLEAVSLVGEFWCELRGTSRRFSIDFGDNFYEEAMELWTERVGPYVVGQS